MLYKFSITDPYNYTKEQIMDEALIFAQNEFDLLGIANPPFIELVLEHTKNNEKIYKFIAKKKSDSTSSDHNNKNTNSKLDTNTTIAAAPPSI